MAKKSLYSIRLYHQTLVIFQDLIIETSNICLVGGIEVMSSLPLLIRNVRFGTNLGSTYDLEDHIIQKFYDSFSGLTVHDIAEATSIKHKIGKREADDYNLRSFERCSEGKVEIAFSGKNYSLTETLIRLIDKAIKNNT